MCKKNKRYRKNFLTRAQKNKIIDYTFSISSIICSILGFALGIFISSYCDSLIINVITVIILTLGGLMYGLAVPFLIFLLLSCISKIVNFIRDCIS